MKKLKFKPRRYNGPYYVNNLGKAIKRNPDGTFTDLGKRGEIIANVVLAGFVALSYALGWYHHKVITDQNEIGAYRKG